MLHDHRILLIFFRAVLIGYIGLFIIPFFGYASADEAVATSSSAEWHDSREYDTDVSSGDRDSMFQFFIDILTFIPTFLMAEPVCYIVGICFGFFAVALFHKLLH